MMIARGYQTTINDDGIKPYMPVILTLCGIFAVGQALSVYCENIRHTKLMEARENIKWNILVVAMGGIIMLYIFASFISTIKLVNRGRNKLKEIFILKMFFIYGIACALAIFT